MAHFFDGEPDFLKLSRLKTMIENSFSQKNSKNTIKKDFPTQKAPEQKTKETQKEKQEKFFEDRKNR